MSQKALSGDNEIDALLWEGWKWDGSTIYYYFPSTSAQYPSASTGFNPLNQMQMDAAEIAFREIANFTAVTISEGTTSGSINLAGALLVDLDNDGTPDLPSDTNNDGIPDAPLATAVGFAPSQQHFEEGTAGDVWYNPTGYDNPKVGSYQFASGIIHEIGHAMGLKHPHDGAPLLDQSLDGMAYTVMSYRDYPGDAIDPISDNDNQPQSYMMLDIAALQYLYGANFTSNGDTVYKFSPTIQAGTGTNFFVNGSEYEPSVDLASNVVFRTIWDPGGFDTYDFSLYTTLYTAGLNVDLNAGAWTQLGTQLAHLEDGRTAPGNIANALLFDGALSSLIERVIGGSGNDTIRGNVVANTIEGGDGNDTLTGGGGNDTLDGGNGTDTAIFSMPRFFYDVKTYGDVTVVKSLFESMSDGTDTLHSIETRKFAGVLFPTSSSFGSDYSVGLLQGGFTTDGGIIPLGGGAWGNEGTAPAPAGDPILATDASEQLYGTSGSELIRGLDGDDVLTGYSGLDTLDGGAGSDTADYSYQPMNVHGTINLENGTGTAAFSGFYTEPLISIENVWMGDGNDTVIGDAGNNDLRGGPGNDTLTGGLGNDHIYGDWKYSDQGGVDTAILSYTFGSDYSVSGSANALHIVGAEGDDWYYNIENFQFAGGVTVTASQILVQPFGIPQTIGNYTLPGAMNDEGDVVGMYFTDAFLGSGSFIFADGSFGTLQATNVSPSAYYTYAAAINNSGQIVGTFVDGGSGVHGFMYENGSYSVLNDGIDRLPDGINDLGHIVGTYRDANGVHGFVLDNGIFATLDHPDVVPAGPGEGTFLTDINNAGQIVGYVSSAGGGTHGFLYSSGVFTAIDDPSSLGTQVFGINDAGQLVGTSFQPGFPNRSFLYSDGAYSNIPISVGAPVYAQDINNHGQIIGHWGGYYTGFITTIDAIASNSAPVAIPDLVAINENGVAIANLLSDNGNGADSDADGDSLAVAAVNGSAANLGHALTLASGATLTVNPDGRFAYDPNGAFNTLNNGQTGTDSFSYIVSDGHGHTDTATVTLSIAGQDDELQVTSGLGDETLAGTSQSDQINGGPGSDTVNGLDGHDWLQGGAGNDALNGQNDSDLLDGGDGNDSVSGGAGDDVLNGDAGNDTLDGGSDIDMVDFSSTTLGVTVNLSAASDQAVGSENGTDQIANVENVNGGSGNDLITGDNNANILVGGSGNDVLVGLAGNDTLDGDVGVDAMAGGEGNDTYVVDNVGEVVSENSGEGTDTIQTTLASYSLGANVENLTFTDNGTHSGSGNELANVLTGRAGDDTFFAGAGADAVFGGYGNDVLVGNADIFASEADTLDGGAGNDTIHAESADTIFGGTGTDFLYVVNSNPFSIDLGATSIEWVQSLFGNDNIDGSSQSVGIEVYTDGGNDTIIGSNFNDFLWPDSGNDTVTGNDGNDVIVGGIGADSLSGGAGNDSIFLEAADSFFDGGTGFDAAYLIGGSGMSINMAATGFEWVGDFVGGNDTIDGSGLSVAAEVYAGGGSDTVTGGTGADFLWGGTGNDAVSGGNGNDVLVGESGADTLIGGSGFDVLYGSTGGGGDGSLDTFVFTAGWGTDIVFDFEDGLDKLDMTALDIGFGDLAVTDTLDGHAHIAFAGNLISVAFAAGQIDAGDFVF